MHDGKSDGPVVPAKPPNNAGRPAAEAVEGRGLAKGNTASKTRPGRRAGQGAPSALDRVRRVAAEGQGRAVHRAPAPRRRRPPAGGVLGASAQGRAGGGRCDVGGVRAGPGGQPSGSARACPSRALPGEAVRRVYIPKRGRAAAAARCRRAGGQDPPACRRGGAQRHLRDGLPGLLLRVPARAQTASMRWTRSRPGSNARR